MIKIVTIVGARPQFIKAATVSRVVARRAGEISEILVHTGQHYDENMSKIFFDELEIPRPAHNLEVGSGSHGAQTGLMLERIEKILLDVQPDWCLVYGDTNSTLAGALAAVKLHIPVAHVEAGLRSYNRRMPEEINRIVADHVSDLLLCPCANACRTLAAEGVTRSVLNCGDTMYDSVLFNRQLSQKKSRILAELGLQKGGFCLATIHRAENTDEAARLQGILTGLAQVSGPIILPLHPRTRKTLGQQAAQVAPNIRLIDPVGYLDMLQLEQAARIIFTDSGGVQKEAYFARVPCVTLRDETEWVELVECGWNQLGGADAARIAEAARRAQALDSYTEGLYGDGRAAEHIVEALLQPAAQ